MWSVFRLEHQYLVKLRDSHERLRVALPQHTAESPTQDSPIPPWLSPLGLDPDSIVVVKVKTSGSRRSVQRSGIDARHSLSKTNPSEL